MVCRIRRGQEAVWVEAWSMKAGSIEVVSI